MPNLAKNAQIPEKLAQAARITPSHVNLVKISKTQLKVLSSVLSGEKVTATQIADRCEISQSFASTLLKRLVERGYMARSCSGHETGGIEFQYAKL